MKNKKIVLRYECWVCPTTEVSDEKWNKPKGWRSVWRGYAGYVDICPLCNSMGLKHKKHIKNYQSS